MGNTVDLYRQIADEAMMGMFVAIGPELELTYINKAAIQMLEIKSDPLEHPPLKARDFFIGSADILRSEGQGIAIRMNLANGTPVLMNVGLKRLHSQPEATLLIMFYKPVAPA
jgi:hypothetical protein